MAQTMIFHAQQHTYRNRVSIILSSYDFQGQILVYNL